MPLGHATVLSECRDVFVFVLLLIILCSTILHVHSIICLLDMIQDPSPVKLVVDPFVSMQAPSDPKYNQVVCEKPSSVFIDLHSAVLI